MQTEARAELDEVWHRCAQIVRAGWLRIFSHVHIGHYHAPVGIYIIAVDARTVIRIFANDVEISRGSRVTFASGGDGGDRDILVSFAKICALLMQADEDGGPSVVGGHRIAAG